MHRLYDKRDTFSFAIVNDIPSKPGYGVVISVSSIFEIYVIITNILFTDPDYLDKDTYTKNSVAPTRPLCIVTPGLNNAA